MIFLFLDFLLSYFSEVSTFFVLLNFLLYTKDKLFSFIFIPLIMDLFLMNTYFFNTILFVLIFVFVKHLKITKTSFFRYLFLISLVYFLYVFSLGLINGYSLFYLGKFVFINYFVNLIFYLLSYKILKPYIKLSR